jgi:hypothetical protein
MFSILSGFLVAIIAIAGDPMLFTPGTWRIAEAERDKVIARLVKKKYLFVLYITTLGL